MGNGKSIEGEYGRSIEFREMPPADRDKIYLEIREGVKIVANIIVPIADLAQALNGLEIKGLHVYYTPPKPRVLAPTGAGAVVKSRKGMLITRTAKDKWVTDGGASAKYPDEVVEHWLNNGQVIVISEGVQL